MITLFGIYEFLFYYKAINVFTCLFVYSSSYYYANLKKKNKLYYNILVSIASIFVIINIDWKSILNNTLYGVLFHVVFSIGIIIGFLKLFEKKQNMELSQYVKTIDEYSYYIYITHLIFIIGPFSLAYIFDYYYLNIILIIAFILTSSVFLKKITEIVMLLHKE